MASDFPYNPMREETDSEPGAAKQPRFDCPLNGTIAQHLAGKMPKRPSSADPEAASKPRDELAAALDKPSKSRKKVHPSAVVFDKAVRTLTDDRKETTVGKIADAAHLTESYLWVLRRTGVGKLTDAAKELSRVLGINGPDAIKGKLTWDDAPKSTDQFDDDIAAIRQSHQFPSFREVVRAIASGLKRKS